MNRRQLSSRTGRPQYALGDLRAAWPHIEEIAQAIGTTVDVRPFDLPDPVSRKEFATVLDGFAEIARHCGDGRRAESRIEQTRTTLDELTGQLASEPASGLAVMVLPARHAFRELASG